MDQKKLLVLIGLPLLCGCNQIEQTEYNEYSSTTEIEITTEAFSVEYDTLQQLYLDIDSNMSYEEMIELVKSTNLPYSEVKYNGSRTVHVAFTEGCTDQKYKKESGDYLEIHYDYPDDENSINDELSKYTFCACVYVPIDSSFSLISYSAGTYYDYYEPGNYISELGNPLDLNKEMSKDEQLKYYFKNK